MLSVPTPVSSRETGVAKFFKLLILVPLAVIILAFAIANRQTIGVSFDPFSPRAGE